MNDVICIALIVLLGAVLLTLTLFLDSRSQR